MLPEAVASGAETRNLGFGTLQGEVTRAKAGRPVRPPAVAPRSCPRG